MDPLRIVIDDDEEPVVHVAERQPGGVAQTTVETGRAIARGARVGWRQLPRRQVATATRRGVVSGLRWLSARFGQLAARLGELE